ncbi:hypothetical protein A0W34_32160 (plasmid) [Rhodococcus sp. BH4]|uniref:AAA family ATPase n=1 Tax=Rhodococcus sp. BH4 TaxID=1807790 RepID=UPI0009C3B481|nr:ATP-binding protein [Rhodococcus sp. BH4]ARE38128.1 hypothetical protein A0W34_32160 [Rhodococcus sp. BH4]
MKITRIETTNVAGLVDGHTDLPDAQVTAVAGANGTGKSKLLACMLIPWTLQMPTARDPESNVEVNVTVAFTEAERAILNEFATQSGWAYDAPVPDQVIYMAKAQPLAGYTVMPSTSVDTLQNALRSSQVLKRQPSLDLVFLPAERRLLPPNYAGVDLKQLSEEAAIAKLAEARSTVQNFGRLDDAEFESYATALCVQGSLPRENPISSDESKASRWDAFKTAVDELLHPKTLLPLTAEHSTGLRIGLPDSTTHPVHDLSSGERQALIIISRVFRAGEGQSFVVIDEPDAYLHPALSTRLLKALRPGLAEHGRMLLATHSPAILDAVSPSAILRLSHDNPPQLVKNESDRLDLYREAGFRASALTQAEILVLTEGDFDATVIPQLLPTVTSSSMQSAGGRLAVLNQVKSLSKYELPIIGIVDADVRAPAPSREIKDRVHVWPAADIEGVLLQDDAFITKAIEGNLLRPQTCPSLVSTRTVLRQLLLSYRENAIAEYAQRLLREESSIAWPSPRGDDALSRLRSIATPSRTAIDETAIENAIAAAEIAWNEALPDPWTMVRGKYIIADFVSKHTVLNSSGDFVSAVLAHTPKVAAMEALQKLIDDALAKT